MFRNLLSRSTIAAVVLVMAGQSAFAQLPGDSPYAKSRETGWPPFYKPLKVTPHDQFYYAMGWCRTNHYHYTAADVVDIDRLPNIDISGEFGEVHPDGFALRVPLESKPLAIHVHPEATRVNVRGEVSVASLKPGALLRFQGAVDRRGQTTEAVEHLELCSASDEHGGPVRPGAEGPIVGKLLRIAGDRLYLGVKTGPIRTVNLQTSATCKVTADVNDFRLASRGSRVHAKGRIYRADDRIPADQVFATEIDITLAPQATP
jgi:hypothetical protein